MAQEDAGGHVVPALGGRAAGEHGQPAAGVAGAESRDGHHDAPSQPRAVRGGRKQGEHSGGSCQQPGQPVPDGPCLAPLAVTGHFSIASLAALCGVGHISC